MNIIGEAENVVIQHGGIRSVHGWLDMREPYKYISIYSDRLFYLFKVIYDFERPDVAQQIASARGFLGEIVYGAEDIVAKIPRPENETTGVVLLESFEPVGLVSCRRLVLAALETVGQL